jgi:hypothetical protein
MVSTEVQFRKIPNSKHQIPNRLGLGIGDWGFGASLEEGLLERTYEFSRPQKHHEDLTRR